jgi:long-chain acyl-CoA synthetase
VFPLRQHLSAAAAPSAEAVVDGPVRLTHEDLARRSASLAACLHHHFGIRTGQVVSAALPNRWEYPVCFAAVNRLGAIFLPVNPQWRAREIRWLVERLDVRAAFVASETRAEWAQSIEPGCLAGLDDDVILEALSGRAADAPPVSGPPAPDAIALLLTTSGSTGRPKIVPRTNAHLLAGAAAVGDELAVGPGHRVLAVVPFHHANGFSNGLLMPLLRGGVPVIARNALPRPLASLVSAERVQLLNLAPVLYSVLAGQLPDPSHFASVEAFLCTGAPLPAPLARLWRSHFGQPVRQLYGSSETGVISIQSSTDPDLPGSVGRPLPPVSVLILDPAGRPLSPGATGEVAVRGPAMMSGYRDEPELNAASFVDGHFRMGDAGLLSPDGLLVLEGRLKRWINMGGVKVDPVEVENVLHELEGVAYCHVLESHNGPGLAILKARIQTRPGSTLSRRDVIQHCRARLAEYKIPREIEFAGDLSGDGTGKNLKEWSSQ